MTESPQFKIERTFKASKELVWKVWTDPLHLARWYGPGVETIIHEFDMRPGGVWRNEMRMKSMSDFSLMTFRSIEPKEKLEWIHQSTDANWAPVANPMMPDWPQKLLTIVTFKEQNGQTHVTLLWLPYEATDKEIACFEAAKDGFGGGWGGGFKIIDEILAEQKG